MARRKLHDQHVLVTGAANGIGRQTADLLVRKGARVTLLDRDHDAVHTAADRLGGDVLPLEADVADAAAVDQAVQQAVAAFGGLDVVVANAGIAPRHSSTILGFPANELERVMAVNVTGVWNTVRAGVPNLQRGGRVVMVASIYAYTNGAMMAPYAASKAAVESLGRSLRVELAGREIDVTVAYFGPVNTGFAQAFDDDPVATAFQAALPAPLVHRIEPEQAAAAVVNGIERGRSRVITPRRWNAIELLRGPFGRLGDRMLARDPKIAEIAAGIPFATQASDSRTDRPSRPQSSVADDR